MQVYFPMLVPNNANSHSHEESDECDINAYMPCAHGCAGICKINEKI